MKSIKKSSPIRIGVFDSGVGGLTVLKELMRKLPNDLFVYFGDTARFPYGNKSAATITQYSIQNGLFLIEKGVDLIVVACNTASAHALETLTKTLRVPVVGVIDAGALASAHATRNQKIGIIGTRGTIVSGAYQKKIEELLPSAQITSLACPLLVSLVEENFTNKSIAEQIIREYLRPLKDASVDTLLLACTHYPLLKKEIEEELGPTVQVIDPAVSLAKEISEMRPSFYAVPQSSVSAQQFFVSDSPERFQEVATLFLDTPLEIAPQLILNVKNRYILG